MQTDVKENKLYSDLTMLPGDEEMSTINFFQGLGFRDNARKIINVLYDLDNYIIKKGFMVGIDEFREFKTCVIELKDSEDREKFENHIDSFSYVEEVETEIGESIKIKFIIE